MYTDDSSKENKLISHFPLTITQTQFIALTPVLDICTSKFK